MMLYYSGMGSAVRSSEPESNMHTIYVYSNETNKLVGQHTADSNEACEAWAEEQFGSNDFHWSYTLA